MTLLYQLSVEMARLSSIIFNKMFDRKNSHLSLARRVVRGYNPVEPQERNAMKFNSLRDNIIIRRINALIAEIQNGGEPAPPGMGGF